MDSVDSVECGAPPVARSGQARNVQTRSGGGLSGALRFTLGKLPRPIRFLGVGAIGLVTDLSIFTLVLGVGQHPFAARLISLALATLVTWRLNRTVTFDPTGRHQSQEALRYALVTAVAQGTNYAVFASLVMAAFAAIPQAAVLAGAVAGAGLSYAGHRLFSFAADLSTSQRRIVLR